MLHEMVGVMFLFFRFHMCVDRDVLVEYFLLVNESLWVYILCFIVPSVAPMYWLVALFATTVALYTTLFCRHLPWRGHESLFLQLHRLLGCVVSLVELIFLL